MNEADMVGLLKVFSNCECEYGVCQSHDPRRVVIQDLWTNGLWFCQCRGKIHDFLPWNEKSNADSAKNSQN